MYKLVLCTIGLHQLPPHRDPPGPVVAICPHCNKMILCHSLDLVTRGVYTSLMITNYPRVLGPMASC